MATVLKIPTGKVITGVNPALQTKYENEYLPLVWVWEPSAADITRWQAVRNLAKRRKSKLIAPAPGRLMEGGQYIIAVSRAILDYLVENAFATRTQAKVLVSGLAPIKNDIDAGDFYEANQWISANGAALRTSLANAALRQAYDEITAPIVFAAENYHDPYGVPL